MPVDVSLTQIPPLAVTEHNSIKQHLPRSSKCYFSTFFDFSASDTVININSILCFIMYLKHYTLCIKNILQQQAVHNMFLIGQPLLMKRLIKWNHITQLWGIGKDRFWFILWHFVVVLVIQLCPLPPSAPLSVDPRNVTPSQTDPNSCKERERAHGTGYF